jgi:creatinine amidohydrolase
LPTQFPLTPFIARPTFTGAHEEVAMDAFETVRIEMLLPQEIEAALAARSVVYIPLGTYEWHGLHLPIGLDALTAHGLCLRAASQDGGLVCPPLYYGTGGDHSLYSWTVMMPDAAHIAALLRHTLTRLDDLGVELAVLFSGHFAPFQLEMIQQLAAGWNDAGRRLRVLALAVNKLEGLALGADHAAMFETTLLWELHPGRVHIDRLPPLGAEGLSNDPWSASRHSPDHPLHGIIGPDPRQFDAEHGPRLLDDAVAALVATVQATGHRSSDRLQAGGEQASAIDRAW